MKLYCFGNKLPSVFSAKEFNKLINKIKERND